MSQNHEHRRNTPYYPSSSPPQTTIRRNQPLPPPQQVTFVHVAESTTSYHPQHISAVIYQPMSNTQTPSYPLSPPVHHTRPIGAHGSRITSIPDQAYTQPSPSIDSGLFYHLPGQTFGHSSTTQVTPNPFNTNVACYPVDVGTSHHPGILMTRFMSQTASTTPAPPSSRDGARSLDGRVYTSHIPNTPIPDVTLHQSQHTPMQMNPGVATQSIENGKRPSHPLCCEECGKTPFKRLHELNRHMTSVHGPRQWLCPLCGKWYTRQDIMKKHVKTVHEGSDTMGEPSDVAMQSG